MAKTATNFYEKNSGFLKSHSEFHSKNLEHFKEARDAYIQQAKDAIAFLKVPSCYRPPGSNIFCLFLCGLLLSGVTQSVRSVLTSRGT